jgi:hypothetical protein
VINGDKLQKEHFTSHDVVLPHFHGYPIRVITATCSWSEEQFSTNMLNVAVSLPGEEGITQLKQMLRSIDVTPGE